RPLLGCEGGSRQRWDEQSDQKQTREHFDALLFNGDHEQSSSNGGHGRSPSPRDRPGVPPHDHIVAQVANRTVAEPWRRIPEEMAAPARRHAVRQVWFPLTVLLVGATATTFVTVQLKR